MTRWGGVLLPQVLACPHHPRPDTHSHSPLNDVRECTDIAWPVVLLHGFAYALEVIENRQGVLPFFDQLAPPAHTWCPDLLLLDLYLPGLDTGAFVQRIKATPQCAALRMLIMTGSDDPAARTEALALGADAFVVKPLSFHMYMQLGDISTALVSGDAQGSARGASGH